MAMTKVYEVDYKVTENGTVIGTAITKIRAASAQEAKRIAKQRTGCLIKDMRIGFVYGTERRAAND